MWKESNRNIVVIFQPNILRIVGFYVRHWAIVCMGVGFIFCFWKKRLWFYIYPWAESAFYDFFLYKRFLLNSFMVKSAVKSDNEIAKFFYSRRIGPRHCQFFSAIKPFFFFHKAYLWTDIISTTINTIVWLAFTNNLITSITLNCSLLDRITHGD